MKILRIVSLSVGTHFDFQPEERSFNFQQCVNAIIAQGGFSNGASIFIPKESIACILYTDMETMPTGQMPIQGTMQ